MAAENVGGKSERDLSFSTSIDEFVNALTEGAEDEHRSELESYEQHVQRIREDMRNTMEDFKSTFIKGYEVILGELSKQYSSLGGEYRQETPPTIKKI